MADQTDFVEDNDNHGGDDEALSSLLLLLKAKGHDDEPDSDEAGFSDDEISRKYLEQPMESSTPIANDIIISESQSLTTSAPTLSSATVMKNTTPPLNKRVDGKPERQMSSKSIKVDDLRRFFHLPLIEVAKKFGVCATLLKRVCRTNNIKKWPYRQILSMTKTIQSLEMAVISCNDDDEKGRIGDQILRLRNCLDALIEDPSTPIDNLSLMEGHACASTGRGVASAPESNHQPQNMRSRTRPQDQEQPHQQLHRNNRHAIHLTGLHREDGVVGAGGPGPSTGANLQHSNSRAGGTGVSSASQQQQQPQMLGLTGAGSDSAGDGASGASGDTQHSQQHPKRGAPDPASTDSTAFPRPSAQARTRQSDHSNQKYPESGSSTKPTATQMMAAVSASASSRLETRHGHGQGHGHHDVLWTHRKSKSTKRKSDEANAVANANAIANANANASTTPIPFFTTTSSASTSTSSSSTSLPTVPTSHVESPVKDTPLPALALGLTSVAQVVVRDREKTRVQFIPPVQLAPLVRRQSRSQAPKQLIPLIEPDVCNSFRMELLPQSILRYDFSSASAPRALSSAPPPHSLPHSVPPALHTSSAVVDHNHQNVAIPQHDTFQDVSKHNHPPLPLSVPLSMAHGVSLPVPQPQLHQFHNPPRPDHHLTHHLQSHHLQHSDVLQQHLQHSDVLQQHLQQQHTTNPMTFLQPQQSSTSSSTTSLSSFLAPGVGRLETNNVHRSASVPAAGDLTRISLHEESVMGGQGFVVNQAVRGLLSSNHTGAQSMAMPVGAAHDRDLSRHLQQGSYDPARLAAQDSLASFAHQHHQHEEHQHQHQQQRRRIEDDHGVSMDYSSPQSIPHRDRVLGRDEREATEEEDADDHEQQFVDLLYSLPLTPHYQDSISRKHFDFGQNHQEEQSPEGNQSMPFQNASSSSSSSSSPSSSSSNGISFHFPSGSGEPGPARVPKHFMFDVEVQDSGRSTSSSPPQSSQHPPRQHDLSSSLPISPLPYTESGQQFAQTVITDSDSSKGVGRGMRNPWT